MAGSCDFLISIRTVPTVWNNLETLRFHGVKRLPTAKMFTNVWDLLLSLRSVRWYLRILIILSTTVVKVQHVTEVMTLHLSDARLDAPYSAVTITDEIPDIWITSLFDLKGMTNPIHRAVVPSMYRAIPKETICASIWKEGKIIATGLGILDRDYIGIYAIHVKENYRGQGFARQICTALLTEGMKKGAENAYLQVVQGNTAAKRLYASLGFTDFYTYWFRVQPGAVTQKGVS